jgi:hypothetical protein
VSLQGTLETFSIPDVLQLLSSTKKSGKLSVTGDRGKGDVWLDSGEVVAADASGDTTSTDPVAVVMALLRLETGNFVFEDGATASDAGAPRDISTLLEEAAALAAEWAELEAVVPSLDAWLSLAEELPEDDVIIDRETWAHIRTAAAGISAGAFGAALDLDAIETARAVKGLVDRGLFEVAEEAPAGAVTSAPPPAAEAPAPAEAFVPVEIVDTTPTPEPATEAEAEAEAPAETWTPLEPISTSEPEPALAVEPEPAAEPASTAFDPNEMLRGMGHAGAEEGDADTPPAANDGFLPAADGGLGGLGGAGVAAPESSSGLDIDPAEAAEMARKLGGLSGEAARALAAAVMAFENDASSPQDMEAALDEVVALEPSINRDVLRKFLGSVNS